MVINADWGTGASKNGIEAADSSKRLEFLPCLCIRICSYLYSFFSINIPSCPFKNRGIANCVKSQLNWKLMKNRTAFSFVMYFNYYYLELLRSCILPFPKENTSLFMDTFLTFVVRGRLSLFVLRSLLALSGICIRHSSSRVC